LGGKGGRNPRDTSPGLRDHYVKRETVNRWFKPRGPGSREHAEPETDRMSGKLVDKSSQKEIRLTHRMKGRENWGKRMQRIAGGEVR